MCNQLPVDTLVVFLCMSRGFISNEICLCNTLALQLVDGDIICFQKSVRNQCTEKYRFPLVPLFLEYMHNHQVCVAHSNSKRIIE